MKLARFSGYPFTLRSPLDPAACRALLSEEFTDRAGRWQHGRTDRRFVGWPTRDGFALVLSSQNGAEPNLARSCALQFRATGDGGTLIAGRYRYRNGDAWLMRSALSLMIGVPLGLPMAALGSWIAVTERAPGALIFAVCGLSPVLFGLWLLLDRGDGGFPAERDRIARHVARLLDAAPVAEPASPDRGTAARRV